VQAAGKSTVADLLARQFDRGVHVRGGQFYRWAVRGWVHPGDERVDHELGRTPRIGLWLDTSAQTAEQTVTEILRRRDEALIREDQ
jgi:hypothetical protein